MAEKRSRLARSSSSSDTSVFSAPLFEHDLRRPIVSRSPLKSPIPKNDAFVNSSRTLDLPVFFSISCSDHDSVDTRWCELQKCGSFLEKCCYCRNRLGEDEEVFMYSYLRAFCSADCRKKQIDMDEDLKKMSTKPKMKSRKCRA